MTAKHLAPDFNLDQLLLVETKVTTAAGTTSYLGYYPTTIDAVLRHNVEGARVVARALTAPVDRRHEIQPYYEQKLARRAEIFDPAEIRAALEIIVPVAIVLALAALAGFIAPLR